MSTKAFQTLARLAASTGSEIIGFIQAGTGATARTVQAKLREIVSTTDFGAAANGVSDDTTPFNNAVTAMRGGGGVFLPGPHKITAAIALVSGLTIYGATNVDKFFGTKTGNESPTMIYQATAATPVFTVGSGVCDLNIRDVALTAVATPAAYTAPVAGKYGIKFEGSRPNSSYRINLERVTFYNFDRAISVVGVDTGSGVDWQCDDVSVYRCNFFSNTTGVYFNTTNVDAWKFENCIWTVWTNGDAIYAERSGYIELDTCYAHPAETSAGVFATGGDFVHLSDYPDNVKMISCQAESLANFLHVDTSTGFENNYNQYTLDGCIVECPCTIARQCKIVSIASRYTFDVNCTGNDVEVHSVGDSWLPTTLGFKMTGLRPRLFVSPGSTQTAKNVTGVATGVATTLFTLPASAGMYDVYVYIADVGSLYTSHAHLACDGTNLVRMGGDNGANLTITVSGRNVQVTQISGAPQTVAYKYLRVA